MISNNFPEPDILFKTELETLEYFKNQPIIRNLFPQLYSDSYNIYYYLKNQRRIFNFESYIDLHIENIDRRIYVGVIVSIKNNNEYENICHSITICENTKDKSNILRKFHFDRDCIINNSNDKPIFHLQFCGELTPLLQSAGYEDKDIDHLYPKLTNPRIPDTPMSLALLLNFLFIEFKSEKTHRIIEDSYWRQLVVKNEELLLKPYYENCYEYFRKRTNKHLNSLDLLQ